MEYLASPTSNENGERKNDKSAIIIYGSMGSSRTLSWHPGRGCRSSVQKRTSTRRVRFQGLSKSAFPFRTVS